MSFSWPKSISPESLKIELSTSRCNSVLISNRGEIARRIIRTCRRMGIRTVAVYSDPDARSAHVAEADAAVSIGPAPAAESYLNIPAILDAAQRAAVDAVHPGFGFLAENADFAAACAAAGITFIGPPPAAITAMGDKRAARELADRCGLPVIPGYDGGDQSDGAFVEAAGRLGYPIMVKASAGGGGKGMRLVRAPEDLTEALAVARSEATAAFGSGDLLLERALANPRHVEIQVLGDAHGHLIHLGERECSIQRRHQKIIEESPSPGLSPDLREEMGAAAVALAAAIGYTGAGTVEFLLDGDRFNFLEMNTRLQVEHPVTELVTGIDLVEWQIRVAEGAVLPWSQADIHANGHAIEARLYAEDPSKDFLPATGPVLLWRSPSGEGIRVDDGIRSGDVVTTYYDPMLAKIIAHGDNRADAVRRLRRALGRTVILGLITNLPYLMKILDNPVFLTGDTTTRFLEEHPPESVGSEDGLALALMAVAVARYRADAAAGGGYWRNNPGNPAPYHFQAGDRTLAVAIQPIRHTTGRFLIQLPAAAPAEVTIEHFEGPDMALIVDGQRHHIVLAGQDGAWWAHTPSGGVRLTARPLIPEPHRPAGAGGSSRAPMPGRVLAVLVAVGQVVTEGQPLIKLEAMKMEHTIRTAAPGIVEAIYFAAGDQVAADELLVRVAEV